MTLNIMVKAIKLLDEAAWVVPFNEINDIEKTRCTKSYLNQNPSGLWM